jgi:hypothetical protein
MVGKAASLLIGVVVGVLVAVAVGGSSSSAGTGPAQIKITDREVRVARVDIGRRGTSPGDVEVIHYLLFNRRVTAKSIGRAELHCTFVDGGRARLCQGTYFLPRGKLVVAGSMRYRQIFDLAIVGGTGLYDNARGTLTVTRTNTGPVRNLVLFRLVG